MSVLGLSTDLILLTLRPQDYKIRKRKRLYKRAKGANDPDLWRKFKKLRNETFDLIRKAKQLNTKKLTDKLKSEKQCTKIGGQRLNSL